MSKPLDAVIVGSGPNGLAAAIALARDGLAVRVIEGADTPGGGVRSAALTRPGFVHDVCAAVFPMSVASPFLRELPLADHGLTWVHPEIPVAHPLDDGTAAVLRRSVDETAAGLGADADAYRRLFGRLTADAEFIFRELLGPIRVPYRNPFAALRFGLPALRSGGGLAEAYFRTEEAKALIAGLAAHAVLPLDARPGGAIALMLGVAGHAVGWPVPAGGSGKLTDALVSYLRSLGGAVETGRWVRTMNDVPDARAVLFDVTPKQLLAIAGDRLSAGYRRKLGKYRYGPGVFKIDWALSGPIPWAAPDCRVAGTVHVGGTLAEITTSEAAGWAGKCPDKPYVLLTQPSVCDPSRAPAGRHTAWGYCHVPNGSTVDMTDAIEAQIERFAPGFRDVVLERRTTDPAGMEAHNPNYVGGDIGGGSADLWQLFARPVASLNPYRAGGTGVYLCSSSTPPGGGVHGLCGYFAAKTVLRDLRRG